MAIKIPRRDGLRYKKLQSRLEKGHEVALMRLTNKKKPSVSSVHLMCECDFDTKPCKNEKGEVIGLEHRRDPEACPSKKAVRKRIQGEARKKHGERWKQMPPAAAVLDIYLRVKNGEYLGQHYSEIIYYQEVSELLGLSEQEGWKACDRLFSEEKLDLNGAILTDYVRRFRFPLEMESFIRYVYEEPLGSPNGDAGDGFLYDQERRLQRRLGFKSGREAFGNKHWPHLDPVFLADPLEAMAGMFGNLAETSRGAAPEDCRKVALIERFRYVDGLDLKNRHGIEPRAFLAFFTIMFEMAFERVESDMKYANPEFQPWTPDKTYRRLSENCQRFAAAYRKPPR